MLVFRGARKLYIDQAFSPVLNGLSKSNYACMLWGTLSNISGSV